MSFEVNASRDIRGQLTPVSRRESGGVFDWFNGRFSVVMKAVYVLEKVASVYEDSNSMIVCFELHGSIEVSESRYMRQEGAPAAAARRANHKPGSRWGREMLFNVAKATLNNSIRFWKFNV